MTDNVKERLEHAREMGQLTLRTMAKVTELFGEIAARDDLSDEDIVKTLIIVSGMATGVAIGDEVLERFLAFGLQKAAEGEDTSFEQSSPELKEIGKKVYTDFHSMSSMIGHAITDGLAMAAEAKIEVMQASSPGAPAISDEDKRRVAIKAAQSFMLAFKLTMKNFEVPDPEKSAARVRELYEENNVSLHTN